MYQLLSIVTSRQEEKELLNKFYYYCNSKILNCLCASALLNKSSI